MTDLIYNISKEAASQLLGVSTRTVDRYLASNRLTSKKMGNKVMLAQEEVMTLKGESDNIEVNSVDVISGSDYHTSYDNPGKSQALSLGAEQVSKIMDEKFDKFSWMLENKDRLLEEKNSMIFGLQKKLGELETRLQTMVALPEHHNEKEQLLSQKKELQNRLDNLNNSLKKEETKNNIFVGLLVIVGLIIVMLMFRNPSSGSKNPTSTNTNTIIEDVP